MEDGIPHCGLDIGAIVLIKARAWAAVVAPNFQGFADLEVIDELFFVFIGHVDNDFWLPVDSQGTCLFVLANARMAPIA